MPKESVNPGARFCNDSPDTAEQESLRTTIAGGRPPGSGAECRYPLGE